MEKYLFLSPTNKIFLLKRHHTPSFSSVYRMLALFGASTYLLSIQVHISISFMSVLFCLSLSAFPASSLLQWIIILKFDIYLDQVNFTLEFGPLLPILANIPLGLHTDVN